MSKKSAKSLSRRVSKTTPDDQIKPFFFKKIGTDAIFEKLQSREFLGAFIFIASVIVVIYLFTLKSKNPTDINQISASNPSFSEATEEVQLKKVYEKQTGAALGEDFSPRFSVYEDSNLGFKIAYPVGFSTSSIDGGVVVKPENGVGAISVVVANGAFSLNVDKSGADKKQADVLEAAGKFISGSFQFTNSGSATQSKERFSGGQGKAKY